MKTITLCRGSSCFSRGNATNAEIIQKFIADNKLEDKITIKGCLCEGECKNGPNVRIDNELFTNVSPESLPDILAQVLKID